MAGSEMKNRKGMRGDNLKGQPVTQQVGAGPRPKPKTAGESRPASTWAK